MSSDNKQVDLSNPCIFSLVQSTEYPTFAVEYKHTTKDVSTDVSKDVTTDVTKDISKDVSNKSTTSITKDDMSSHNQTEKFDINNTKSNMIRNIFLIALFVLIIYIIYVIINEKKTNKRFYTKPNLQNSSQFILS